MHLLYRENLARIAKFHTKHGDIETPTVLPVINPNLNFLSESELRSLGAQAVITNSYIIRRTDSLRENALKYGVHKLIGFNGPIMTDSGTFQSYVYGDIEYTNKEIVDFQKKIGSDIITILDIFTRPEDKYEESKHAVEETYRRLQEIDIGDDIIAGPIQGSVYPDLRSLPAQLMSRAPYLPIGGVVPLLESYRYDDLVKIIINSKINADFSRPVHLFGGGHPMFFAFSVMLGVDLFDSASYIKYAKDNRILYHEGTRSLKDLLDFPEWSPLYGRYKPQELIQESEEIRLKELAKHNLKAIFMEINEIKERIYENTLYQYVEEIAHAHPALYRAYINILSENTLTKFQSISSKSPFYYFDSNSLENPWVKRLKNYTYKYISNGKKTILIPKKLWKPGMPTGQKLIDFYEQNDFNILVPWNGIYIPVELENTFPVGQMVSSELIFNDLRDSYIRYLKSINDEVIPYTDYTIKEKIRDFDLEKINTVFDYQFGVKNFFNNNDQIIKSKTTGHIRNIIRNSKLIATMRNDGFFTLTPDGGIFLLAMLDYPLSRVVVTEDSAEFNSKGYNVFFKFILDFDHNIIAGNDVLVVDSSDRLCAVGKATVSGTEMKYYKDGIAVKVHRGIK